MPWDICELSHSCLLVFIRSLWTIVYFPFLHNWQSQKRIHVCETDGNQIVISAGDWSFWFSRSICDLGQFATDWDAMRIPSTKRICFVATTHKEAERNPELDRIEEFVKSRRKDKQFEPRNIAEEVRAKNCQTVDKSIRDKIIKVRKCDKKLLSFFL